MKTKNIILITLAVPVFLAGAWFLFKLKPLPEYKKATEFRAEDFLFYGEDGTSLPGEYLLPEKPLADRVIFFQADQKLDRSWNSQNMDFETGKIISRIIAEAGIPAVVYDQRGTGKSVLSGKNHPTPENLASDFNIVYENARLKFPENAAPEIIAHGHGCMPALIAVNKYRIPVKRIYLLSCVFPGTLLDSWLRQILNNMDRAGVDEKTIAEGNQIINAWKNQERFKLLADGETNEVRNKNQDIQSLYRALDYMQSEKMIDWTNQAKDASFLNELNALNPETEVHHLLAEYDEEFAENLVLEWKEILSQGLLKKKKGYTFKIMAKTDHFFNKKTSPTRGVISLMLHRVSPFTEMETELYEELLNPRSAD